MSADRRVALRTRRFVEVSEDRVTASFRCHLLRGRKGGSKLPLPVTCRRLCRL